jgi:hypothetical protein
MNATVPRQLDAPFAQMIAIDARIDIERRNPGIRP